jgi:hypothetical protein
MSRLRTAWAGLVELVRAQSIPDPPAGRPVIYLDERIQRPVMAIGSRRFELSAVDRSAAAAGDLLTSNGASMVRLGKGAIGRVLTSTGTGLAWSAVGGSDLVGSASGSLSLSNMLSLPVVVWGTIAVTGARAGHLVAASLGGAPPSEVAGGVLAYVSSNDTVRVGVPISQTVGDIAVPVVVAVYAL